MSTFPHRYYAIVRRAGGEIDMRKILKTSLSAVWALFLLISIPFRTAQMAAKGDMGLLVDSDKFWVPAAVIGATFINLPDLVSVGI